MEMVRLGEEKPRIHVVCVRYRRGRARKMTGIHRELNSVQRTIASEEIE